MKKVVGLYSNPRHWVGDGSPVRTLFNYDDLGRELSPFLMLDFVGRFFSRRLEKHGASISIRIAASRP